MAFHLGFQKDPKMWIFVLVFVALGIAATMLANECSFLQKCDDQNYNPAIILDGE